MPIIDRHDLHTFETPGGNATSPIATPSQGASEVSVIRQRQQPGGTNPLHTHDREEVLVMLAGGLQVTLGDEPRLVDAGDAVVIPAGTPHKLENTGDQEAEWLIVAPAGVRFFSAAGEEMFPGWAR